MYQVKFVDSDTFLGLCIKSKRTVLINKSIKNYPRLLRFVIRHEIRHLSFIDSGTFRHKVLDYFDKLKVMFVLDYWRWYIASRKHKHLNTLKS